MLQVNLQTPIVSIVLHYQIKDKEQKVTGMVLPGIMRPLDEIINPKLVTYRPVAIALFKASCYVWNNTIIATNTYSMIHQQTAL